MAVRLKDIADRLNVSISTVSYALNNGPRTVPEETRDKVLKVARDMGYFPNRIARQLAAGRTMTIGVAPVVADLITNPYFQGCFTGIVAESKASDYDVLVYTHDAIEASRLPGVLLDGRADGLVFLAPFAGMQALEKMEAEKMPFSIISGVYNDRAGSFNCDNEGGVILAVRHLFDLGHRRIAHFSGDLSMIDGAERLAGFRKAMADLGLPVKNEWLRGEAFSAEVGYREALKLLSRAGRPTAIVSASDDITAGVYRAAWELGVRIPHDLSVASFDDSVTAQLLAPQLTSIRQPLGLMGAAAARAVIDLIAGKEVRSQTFPTELVVRQSTSAPLEAE